MKREVGTVNDVRKEQSWWIARLLEQGYLATWRPGAVSAWALLRWYMDGPKTIITGSVDVYDRMS